MMPRIAGGQTGGVCSHVVNRGNAGMAAFHDEDDFAAFVDLLGAACERAAVRVVGCCVLANHCHLICRPREDGELST